MDWSRPPTQGHDFRSSTVTGGDRWTSACSSCRCRLDTSFDLCASVLGAISGDAGAAKEAARVAAAYGGLQAAAVLRVGSS
jgi:hypothetical protein